MYSTYNEYFLTVSKWAQVETVVGFLLHCFGTQLIPAGHRSPQGKGILLLVLLLLIHHGPSCRVYILYRNIAGEVPPFVLITWLPTALLL